VAEASNAEAIIAALKLQRLDELLPWNWKKAQAAGTLAA